MARRAVLVAVFFEALFGFQALLIAMIILGIPTVGFLLMVGVAYLFNTMEDTEFIKTGRCDCWYDGRSCDHHERLIQKRREYIQTH